MGNQSSWRSVHLIQVYWRLFLLIFFWGGFFFILSECPLTCQKYVCVILSLPQNFTNYLTAITLRYTVLFIRAVPHNTHCMDGNCWGSFRQWTSSWLGCFCKVFHNSFPKVGHHCELGGGGYWEMTRQWAIIIDWSIRMPSRQLAISQHWTVL